MSDDDTDGLSRFSVSAWTPEGDGTLEATGVNLRSALEAGLSAALELALGSAPRALGHGHSAPVRGEGDDPAELFAEMVEDLWDQVAFFGTGLHNVVVDGVLRRDDGGYVAWGYAVGTHEATIPLDPPQLVSVPPAIEDSNGITLKATLRRASPSA